LIASLFWLVFAVALSACNVADEGGGIAAECIDDDDCSGGVCLNGACEAIETDAGNNGVDASNNVMPDMAMADMAVADAGPDMAEMGPMCPEGRVDRNGDPADGCELPAHPAAADPACDPCWELPDAVGGCSAGSCQITACLNAKTDRDGMPMNGCEEDCGPGECWAPIAALQDDYMRIDDDWTEVPVWRFDELAADQALAGPALVDSDSTTVWLGRGDTARVTPTRWLDMRIGPAGG